jgi:hypothetical protein
MVIWAGASAVPASAQTVPADSARNRVLDASAMSHMRGMKSKADTGHAASGTAMPMPAAPLAIPMQRDGSGTSWLPDASPMHAFVSTLRGWNVMLHGVAFVQYDDQQNPNGSHRGDTQFGSVNWGMLAASHPLAGGLLGLRGMFSAEPFTVGSRGYPLLLQSGEEYNGQSLHDRQHPHDLFMELAALYDHALSDNLAASLYVAPVGEPAIGPGAFPHRPSASSDPLAPIGHHWQDATHISFGVITGGIYTHAIRIEGSIFNGREPDQIRTNFDYKGRSLDSYAGRITINPDAYWSVSGSYAFLKSPEQLEPTVSTHRIVASAMYNRPYGTAGSWASSLIYGANEYAGNATLSSSVLAETNLDLGNRNTVFGRAEFVQKSPDDLAIVPDAAIAPAAPQVSAQQYVPAGAAASPTLNVGELTLGYLRELSPANRAGFGVGIAGTLNFVPAALEATYGSRTPAGGVIFVRLRPGLMNMGMHNTSQKKMQMHDMCYMSCDAQ